MSDDASVKQSALGYFKNPDVVAEIVAAHGHFVAGPADADPFAAVLAHAQFSMAFLIMGDAERARQHLVAQGMSAVGPWRAVKIHLPRWLAPEPPWDLVWPSCRCRLEAPMPIRPRGSSRAAFRFPEGRQL